MRNTKMRRLFKARGLLTVLLALMSALVLAQTKTVTGTVVDEKGESIIGASVSVKGTTVGTITDLEGGFSIQASPQDVLFIKFVGYLEQSIPVGNQTRFNIVMEEDNLLLEEVVVVGYGVQKKSDVTGALARVDSKDLTAMPVKNAIEGMQGKAAGVDVISSDRPGSVATMQIRGMRSMIKDSDGNYSGNKPLYVVDGIPLSAGGIEAINPQDIESIDVLKDASATAIYGSRGANGVVLVTTKKGNRDGKTTLTYTGTLTVSNIHNDTDYMNSDEYITFRRQAYRTAGQYPENASGVVPDYESDKVIFNASGDPAAWSNIERGWANGTWNGSLVPTTDWAGMVKRTGITQEHNLQAMAGSEKMQSYFSFGYLKQDGTNKGQDYERYTAKVGTDIQATPWFKYGGSINGTWSDQNYGYKGSGSRSASGIYAQALGMYPYAQPYDADGNWIYLPGGYTNVVNPIGEDKKVIDERKTLRVLGSFYGEMDFGKMIKPLDGLRFRVNFGPDFREYRQGIYRLGSSILQGTGQDSDKSYAKATKSQNLSYTFDKLLYYNREFGLHNLGATLLHSASMSRYEDYSMTAQGQEYDSQLWYAFQLNNLDAKSSKYEKSTLESYMVRFNYGFKDRYLLTVSGRWDGASQLSQGHKWEFFPSAALAWRIEQEQFMESLSWVSQLKLRLGIGTTGNAAVAAYDTQGAIAHVYYPFADNYSSGYYASDFSLENPPKMANRSLTWEKTTQWNLGLDFSVLKNRISGSVDVYTSKTKDLLLAKTILSLTGYTSTVANVGQTSNKGIDITLSTRNIDTKDFTWNTNFTYSANKDKIEELSNGKQDDMNNKWFIGKPIHVAYDYDKIGIWQTADADLMAKYNENGSVYTYKAGDVRVRDVNGDNKIAADDDRVVVGQYTPKWTAGMTNTFNYKGLELSFFIYSRWGFIMDGGAADVQGVYMSRKIDYWTPENATNAYPRPNYNNGGQPNHYSAMNYQDGSFIKMKNISLGYNFPNRILKGSPLSALKVYVQAMDPFMIYRKCDFMDGDYRSSVTNKSWVFGLNVSF